MLENGRWDELKLWCGLLLFLNHTSRSGVWSEQERAQRPGIWGIIPEYFCVYGHPWEDGAEYSGTSWRPIISSNNNSDAIFAYQTNVALR
jgi:hypothetical protein